MTSEYVQIIIDKNALAANTALLPQDDIDQGPAELTLRNAAVLAERLRPILVAQLGPESQAALSEAARVAEQVAPMPDADKQYLGHEDDEMHNYRVGTYGPLLSLQALVRNRAYNPANRSQMDAVKEAIWLANAAFTTVLADPVTEKFAAVNETLRYFDGNATAASHRAETVLTEQQR